MAQSGRIAADMVLGQADFVSSNSTIVSATSLKLPVGIAMGPNGNLFVSDTGNNRALEFAAGPATHAAAIRVYGNIGQNSISVRLADTSELLAGGTLLVAANSPGFFTLSQDGKGQAAARNQDGITVNGPANPAPHGSVISLYGTGQGQVSPAVADGVGAPASPPATTVAVPTPDVKPAFNSSPPSAWPSPPALPTFSSPAWRPTT